MRVNEEAIISMLKKRPCTGEEIAGAFGMHFNEVSKISSAGQLIVNNSKDDIETKCHPMGKDAK